MNKSSVRSKPFAANVVTITRNIDDYNSNIFYRSVYPTDVTIYGIEYSDGSDLLNLPDVGDIEAPNGPTVTLGISAFLTYQVLTLPEILPP